MIIKIYDEGKVELAKKYLSSDGLLIVVCDTLCRGKSLSVVRMGDGERSLILGLDKRYLKDEVWLKEYGLLGADLKSIGKSIVKAANRADYFCPNISGLMIDRYELIPLAEPRKIYGSGLLAHEWLYMGRVPELMKYTGGVGIVCRNSKVVADKLCDKYSIVRIENADYDSWKDYRGAMEAIGNMRAKLIFCSVGPSGKYLVVEAAKKHNKVIIDTGSAMMKHWAEKKTREI